MREFLERKLSYEQMREKGIIATRQLAKRQLTWLPSWPDGMWFDSEEVELVNTVAEYVEKEMNSVRFL